MFRRPILSAPFLVALFMSFSAIAQGPFESPEHAERIHYFNGDIRVERLLALDEVFVSSTTGRDLQPQDFAGPGWSARSIAPGRERLSLQFDTPAANRAQLNARVALLKAPDVAVRAVAYAPGPSERSDDHREVVTNRLSVKPRDPEQLDEILAQYDLEVERTIGSAYIVRTRSDDLLAAVEAANALYESGAVEFATPLVERQQQMRLIPNDSLFPQQWHLNNTAQVSGAVAGNDANIIEVWDTYTGAGVNIAITDTGVHVDHPDLSPNARTDIDWDINDNDDDPTPNHPHGTSVAGISAAAGNNDAGVTGAAFDAGIVGIRLIEDSTTDADEAMAMEHQIDPVAVANRVHVNNNSWGPWDDGIRLETFGPLTESALNDGVTIGRGGLGVVYVWAAGNGRESNDNVNYDGYASSRYTIAVGASGANGGVSFYSEPGASMLVNMPSSYETSGGTRIGTTTTTSSNSYTDGFGGTSSAAPLAAGSVALMLEANPQLGWRDVQHILVDTAFQNQPGSGEWFANGSGLMFNHNYGFGRLDTQAAIARGLGWTNVGAATQLDSGVKAVNAAIPDNNSGGVTDLIAVTSVPAGFFVEHVEVILNTSHSRAGDLQVELTSPAGTKSALATTKSTRTANYSNWKFTSVAHWGENPAGSWSLKIADQALFQAGTFTNWRLIVYGFVIGTNTVGVDASHSGFVNGHPNWPYTGFMPGYSAVDSGGTLIVKSHVNLSQPVTLSKPVTIRAPEGPVEIRVTGS